MTRFILFRFSIPSRTALLLLLSGVPFLCFSGGWQEGGDLVFPEAMGVELQTGSMNVEIVPADGETVTFKAEGLKTGDRILHEIGDYAVRIRLERSSEPGYGESPGTARLGLPPGTIVRVFTTTGDIAGRDILGDSLFVNSRDGDIELTSFNAPLDLRSAAGSITVQKSGGSKRLSSASGDITVLDSDGSLEASSAIGALRFERIRGRVYLHGGTGDVSVSSVNGGLRVYTSTGNIACTGILLTDDADFRSNTGNVSVEFLNEPSGVAFDLSTTTGRIALGEKTSTSTMIVNARTDINVTGRSSTGIQTYSFGSPPPEASSAPEPGM